MGFRYQALAAPTILILLSSLPLARGDGFTPYLGESHNSATGVQGSNPEPGGTYTIVFSYGNAAHPNEAGAHAINPACWDALDDLLNLDPRTHAPAPVLATQAGGGAVPVASPIKDAAAQADVIAQFGSASCPKSTARETELLDLVSQINPNMKQLGVWFFGDGGDTGQAAYQQFSNMDGVGQANIPVGAQQAVLSKKAKKQLPKDCLPDNFAVIIKDPKGNVVYDANPLQSEAEYRKFLTAVVETQKDPAALADAVQNKVAEIMKTKPFLASEIVTADGDKAFHGTAINTSTSSGPMGIPAP